MMGHQWFVDAGKHPRAGGEPPKRSYFLMPSDRELLRTFYIAQDDVRTEAQLDRALVRPPAPTRESTSDRVQA